MKKFLFIAILCPVFFACANNDEFESMHSYPFLSRENFNKAIVGSAWKNVLEQPIDINTMTVIGPDLLHRDSNGIPSPGVSVCDLYFSKDQMISYFECEAIPASCFSKANYIYEEEKGALRFVESTNKEVSSLFEFKSLQNDSLQIVKFNGYDNGGKLYTLATYVRMSEEKFEEIKKTYTTDYDKWSQGNNY